MYNMKDLAIKKVETFLASQRKTCALLSLCATTKHALYLVLTCFNTIGIRSETYCLCLAPRLYDIATI